MAEYSYTYLFPFEKVKPKARIVIYGAGRVGCEYLRQIRITHYCEVIGVVDRAYEKKHWKISVYAPQIVLDLLFDYIVVAVANAGVMQDVIHQLLAWGIAEEKIVSVGQRLDIDSTNSFFLAARESFRNQIFAFQKTDAAIALKWCSHLGDNIQRKGLFIELARVFPGCLVDIFVSDGRFVHSLYCDQTHLHSIIDDGIPLYYEKKARYLLAMEVQYAIHIDYVNYRLAENLGETWKAKLELLQKACEEYHLPLLPITQSRIQCERALYKGWNCYSFYNYTGLIHVRSSKVPIPLQENALSSFTKLGLCRYITINCATSRMTPCGTLDARQWPFNYFQRFVSLFRHKYPEIEIVQVGDEKAFPLLEANRKLMGQDIELIKYVLKNAIFHLDSEGGLTHLATQLGTKCIVLFGPTQVELLGYSQNINIVASTCKGCYFLYDDMMKCARDLQEPECMHSITPELVMEKVDTYLMEVDCQANFD